MYFDCILLLLFDGWEGELFYGDLLSSEGSAVAFEYLYEPESRVSDLVQDLKIIFEISCG